MYKEYEASGKTLDEALDRVSLMSGRSLDELTIEIIDMPSRGLFGIGQKNARVRASFDIPQLDEIPTAEEPAASTFGKKKSKREKLEAKAVKSAAEIEIAPIVSIEPGQVSAEQLQAELKAQAKPSASAPASASAAKPEAAGEDVDQPGQWPQRSERGPRAPRAERPERAERSERSERPPRQPRAPRPAAGGEGAARPPRTSRPERPERPARAPRSEQATGEAAPRRRENHATPVTEGEMAQSLTALALNFLNPIFAQLEVTPQAEVSIVDGILWLAFGGDKLGLLIGRRGETLNALQYLTNLAVNKDRSDHVRVVLDVSGYRSSREETLTAMARKMADKAVRTGRRVELEPMNPHERRVVHIALQGDRRVETISHGEEPYRRVVITSKQRRPRNNGRGRARLAELPENAELPLGGGSLEDLVPDAPLSQGDDSDAIYALLSRDENPELL